MRPAGREGAAVVVVLLVALAITGLAHGLLVMAGSELTASRAGARLLAERAAAEAAVAGALQRSVGSGSDTVALWDWGPTTTSGLGSVETRVALRRLSAEAWLVEASAHGGPGAATRVAHMAWILDPLSRVAAFGSVLSTSADAEVVIEGSIDGGSVARVEAPLTVAACRPWAAHLDSIFGPGVRDVGRPWPPGALPRLGLLEFRRLLLLGESAGPVLTAAVGTPSPTEQLGVCSPADPWNWGDPHRPWSPCGSHVVLVTSATALRVAGGVGQGVLIVDGDVRLTDGARFYGLVIASGAIVLEDDSTLQGFALTAGGAHVGPLASVKGSACWALRALSAARGVLSVPVVPAGVGWIGPLGEGV